jgi:hypothetical protein
MEGDPEENGVGWRPRYMPDTAEVAAIATGCTFWASPVTQQPSLLGVDVSDFEGVTFWARRGPSGQSTLRIALVDNNTSPDLARQMERDYWFDAGPTSDPDNAGAECKRIEECCRKCDEELEHQEWVVAKSAPGPDTTVCVAGEMAGFRTITDKRCHIDGERLPHFECRPPASGGPVQLHAWDFRNGECGNEPDPEKPSTCWSPEAKEIWDQWDRDFEICCPTTMEEELDAGDPSKTYGDPRWGGTACRPYVFQFDYSSGNYCQHEGEVLPERNQNRCDEVFESSVVVDTEWKLFRVPWSELRRFTPDKPPFNPKSVWQIGFYFGQGFLDTYIDDVGFYRKRR